MAFQSNTYDPTNPQRRRQQPAQNTGIVPQQQGGSPVPQSGVVAPPPRPPRARPAQAMVNGQPVPVQRPAQSIAPPRQAVAAPQANTQAPQNFQQQYENFASQGLQSPSRYDQSTVANTVSYINQALDKARQDRIRNNDEYMASRGTIGSSVENEYRKQIEDSIGMERLKQLTDYQNTVAQTNAADRSTAASIAGQVAGLNQRDKEFATTTGLTREQMAQQGSQFDKSLAQDSTQFNASLGQQDRLAQLNAALQREGMAQSGNQFSQSLAEQKEARQQNAGFTQQDIDFRAKQLQQQATQFGQSMSMEQAQFLASQQMQREQMGQQNSQFQQEIGVRERELQNSDRMAALQLALQAIGMGGTGFSGGTSSSGGYGGATSDKANDPQWLADRDAAAKAGKSLPEATKIADDKYAAAHPAPAAPPSIPWMTSDVWDEQSKTLKANGYSDAQIAQALGNRPQPFNPNSINNYGQAAENQTITVGNQSYVRKNGQWVPATASAGNAYNYTNPAQSYQYNGVQNFQISDEDRARIQAEQDKKINGPLGDYYKQVFGSGTGYGNTDIARNLTGDTKPGSEEWLTSVVEMLSKANPEEATNIGQMFRNQLVGPYSGGPIPTDVLPQIQNFDRLVNRYQNQAAPPSTAPSTVHLPSTTLGSGFSATTPVQAPVVASGPAQIEAAPPGWTKVSGGYQHSSGVTVDDANALAMFQQQGTVDQSGRLTPVALQQIQKLKTYGALQ